MASDMISREALKEEMVKDLANTMRMTEMHKGDMAVRVLNKIDEAQAVDAVEVVRCKECVFYQPFIQEMYKGKGDCEEHDAMVYDDDFCSYGRKLVKKDAVD